MQIRESNKSDEAAIRKLHIVAFGKHEGPIVAGLVKDLFADTTAMPRLSLVAVEDNHVIGHILFTKALITQTNASARILAPLGVLPTAQRMGVGSRLIREGLARLRKCGVDLVLVLGYPDYYSRNGFSPAGRLGLDAPYPIPVEHADAWMVQTLKPDAGTISGKVQCSDVLNRPEHWRE